MSLQDALQTLKHHAEDTHLVRRAKDACRSYLQTWVELYPAELEGHDVQALELEYWRTDVIIDNPRKEFAYLVTVLAIFPAHRRRDDGLELLGFYSLLTTLQGEEFDEFYHPSSHRRVGTLG